MGVKAALLGVRVAFVAVIVVVWLAMGVAPSDLVKKTVVVTVLVVRVLPILLGVDLPAPKAWERVADLLWISFVIFLVVTL